MIKATNVECLVEMLVIVKIDTIITLVMAFKAQCVEIKEEGIDIWR